MSVTPNEKVGNTHVAGLVIPVVKSKPRSETTGPGQTLSIGTDMRAGLLLTCHPLGEKLILTHVKRVRIRGSHNTSGLAFPFSTLGCTAA